MASGNNNAHAKKRLPGKLRHATSHPAAVPPIATPTPTTTASASVLATYLGNTVAARQSQIQLKQDTGALKLLTAGANLADVVKALNVLGATPADLISILQSMKAAGALRADLEII